MFAVFALLLLFSLVFLDEYESRLKLKSKIEFRKLVRKNRREQRRIERERERVFRYQGDTWEELFILLNNDKIQTNKTHDWFHEGF